MLGTFVRNPACQVKCMTSAPARSIVPSDPGGPDVGRMKSGRVLHADARPGNLVLNSRRMVLVVPWVDEMELLWFHDLQDHGGEVAFLDPYLCTERSGGQQFQQRLPPSTGPSARHTRCPTQETTRQ